MCLFVSTSIFGMSFGPKLPSVGRNKDEIFPCKSILPTGELCTKVKGSLQLLPSDVSLRMSPPCSCSNAPSQEEDSLYVENDTFKYKACFLILFCDNIWTEMLSSVFSFYHVKPFLHVYKTSEVAFFQAQIILVIWNVLNDPNGYFHSNSKATAVVSYGAPLCALAFLLPWFPWQRYSEGDWLSGLRLMVSSCAFDSTLTSVQQARCALFVEICTRRESRLPLVRMNQAAALAASTGVLLGGLLSDSLEILFHFQAAVVGVAVLAAVRLYTGMGHLPRWEPKRSPKENAISESGLGLPRASIVSQVRQTLTQSNFRLFLMKNFFQVFHLTFLRNFMMIFAEGLIPREGLPSSIRSVYGAGFICPQCLVLMSQSWLKKFGYYKIILISFYLEGTASVVMLLLGR